MVLVATIASAVPWPLKAGLGLMLAGLGTLLLIRRRQHLFTVAVAASLIEIGLLIGGRGLVHAFGASGRVDWLRSVTIAIPPAVAGLGVLSWFRWWTEAGFTAPSRWRDMRLACLLVVFLALPGLVLLGGIRVPGNTVLPIVVYVLVDTGMEELYYRGIVLRATIGYGVIPAVLISSLLFGASHANNFFSSSLVDPLYIAVQMWLATLIGIFFAAMRLRLNAIWFTMAAHAAYDLFPLLVFGARVFAYRPTLVGTVGATVFFGVFAGIGLLLLRGASPSIIPSLPRPAGSTNFAARSGTEG